MRPSKRFQQWLAHQTDDPRRNLNRVLAGATVFFIGLALIYYAEKALPSSLAQEITALGGLACLVGGGILAAIGYLSLSLLRIIRFLSNDPDQH